VRFAVGDAAAGVPGFRLTHRQAVGAHAVAVHATGPAAQRLTSFRDIAPLALMSGSTDLMREWVLHTLGSLADDDDQNLRLRETLRVFLAENGSFKAIAERLTLHKNTVQYRVRKAEEGLAPPSTSTASALSWPCSLASGSARPSCVTPASSGRSAC
jgi:DNA-binding PucR family transcriptional regulator